MKPGSYEGITNENYHAGPGISSSNVVDMGTSFRFFNWRKTAPREPSASQEIGTATHAGLLEPELFEKTYVAGPDDIRRGTKAWDAFLAQHPGKTVLKQADFDRVRGMIDAVLDHSEAASFLSKGRSEVSCYAMYPGIDLLVKCRPDKLRIDDALSINFKTSRDASYDGFVHAVKDYHYDWASAFYIDILNELFGRNFDELHLVVESEAPYHVGLYTIDNDDLDFARAQYRPLLERYLECKTLDVWPGLPSGVQCVKLPAYARKVVMS